MKAAQELCRGGNDTVKVSRLIGGDEHDEVRLRRKGALRFVNSSTMVIGRKQIKSLHGFYWFQTTKVKLSVTGN